MKGVVVDGGEGERDIVGDQCTGKFVINSGNRETLKSKAVRLPATPSMIAIRSDKDGG